MLNLQNEISREIPKNIPDRYFAGGIPILTAFECALIERQTASSFVYTAVNLTTGRKEVLERRKNPVTTYNVVDMVDKLHRSSVAGAGRFEAERMYGNRIDIADCRAILHYAFKAVLPEYGYAIRKDQIALAESILNTISRRKTSLAEAEVGTGKTHAYLIAAILAKRGRLNDFWNKSFYPKMSYVDMAQMPIVIATSSIALQRAIVTDYIPELSRILLAQGIIKTPLTAVLRKGREHYICERNLRSRLRYEHNAKSKQILTKLLAPKAPIDTAEVEGLDAYTKRKITVPERCTRSCPHRDSCAYLRFRDYAGNPAIDIQVVNHNYFLADVLRRADMKSSGNTTLQPLLPNYQTVIIDEAHKFLAAARSMYGVEISSSALADIKNIIFDLHFQHESAQSLARKTAKKLSDESKRLFKGLEISSHDEDSDDDASRFTAVIDVEAVRHLRNLRNIADSLYELISSEPVTSSGDGKRSQILWDLGNAREQLSALTRYSEQICWLEKPNMDTTPGADPEILLCAIPKDLDKKLHKDLWSKGIPTILTSGTLSAGGDFAHIKRTLGLAKLGDRLTETRTASPFSHRENALLYISETMPFPNNKNRDYITEITAEIERLIYASHGHTAVLFTSYDAMGRVYASLSARKLPFPLFRLERSNSKAIEQFKQSAGGVLFASGTMWEGVDIPGDALSMLIIVKLPFAVPDPIGEYEQTLYPDMFEYKNRVIVPEMLIKLKQGFGRLIRTESDTGVVAILDSRAASGGAYRARVLEALPDCRVTAGIGDVEDFINAKKSPDYFA